MTTPYPLTGIVTEADLADEPDAMPTLPGRDFIATMSPDWDTVVRRSVSAREVRISNRASPQWRFKLRHNFMRDLASKPEVATLLAFFNSRMGRFGFFYYPDPLGQQVTNQGFGTGDGEETVFQLMRTINFGGSRTSITPVHSCWLAPVIRKNGVVVADTDYTVLTWGRIQFDTAPADGDVLTWTGKWLHVCRFDQDEMDLEQMARDLWSQDGVQFVSIRP